MAYTTLCLVSYTLCFNSFVIAFPTNGFVTDWRHLSSGLAEFRNSRNDDWRKDGSRPIGTKHNAFVDGDYDVIVSDVAHVTTGDSKLENSEKLMPTKEDKKIKNKNKIWQHIFPLLLDDPKVARNTHLSSQKPEYTSTLRDSSDHYVEEDVKLVYGILKILFPFKLKKHSEGNGTSSHDDEGDTTAHDDNQSVAAKSLEPQKQKFRSLRKKRDNFNDEIETIWKRLLHVGAGEEVEKYVPDECEMCNSPVKKEKRDTESVSVETTTPTGKANVTNNLNETSERSENSTDDPNKKPVSRLLDIQITTSLPPSTTSKQGQKKIEDNQEETRAATETSLKSTNVTTSEATGGPMGVEDDFAYIIDPQEIHLDRDNDTASGQFETSRGKIITLHWTIKFEPKANTSGSEEHPHPPADDGRDVFEQVIYVDPNSDDSTEGWHTTDIPKHTESGEDSSEHLVLLPLPFETTQVLESLETAELIPVDQIEIPDVATVPVMELPPQNPITVPPEDSFRPQDVLVYPLDQPASDTELINVVVDTEPESTASIPSLQDELVDMVAEIEHNEPHDSLVEPDGIESDIELINSIVDMESEFPASIPSLQDELVDMVAETEDNEPHDSVVELDDTESESVYLDPNTVTDMPSVLEVVDSPTAPDMELISQQPIVEPTEDWLRPQDTLVPPLDQVSPDLEVVDAPVDTDPGLPVSIPSLQDELVVMETTNEDYDPDALLSTPSPLDKPANMEVEVMPTLEVVDIPAPPDMDLLLQQPLTESPEDSLTPQEELVHPLDQSSSDIVIIDTEDDIQPEHPETIPSLPDEQIHIETGGVDDNPDTLLSVPSSQEEPVDMESESAHFDPETSVGIPSVVEMPPEVESILQEAIKDTPEVLLTPQVELVNPLEQPSLDNVATGGSVNMESEISGSNPPLQDELVESVGENDETGALLSIPSSMDEPVNMESQGTYFDPNSSADILVTVDDAKVDTTGLVELLVDALTGEQSGPTTLSSLDEPVAMQPELPVVLVEASTDKLPNVQSATNEPDAFATTTLPVYEDYALIYDGEDHGDHIDHTQDPCPCRRSNTPAINDRPRT